VTVLKRTLHSLFGIFLVLSIGCGSKVTAPATATNNKDTNGETIPFVHPDASKDQNSVENDVARAIPSGTAITVRLQMAVSSAVSNPGDSFQAVLDQPIEANGTTLAPQGAPVVGRVINVRRSGRLSHPALLRIVLSSIVVNGKAVSIQSSSITVAGVSHKKRNLAWIGGGAGGGALIGALAGGGQGALIGSLIGAGAGTTTAFMTGKKDVGFGPERRLTFRLTKSVNIG
jgi:hypothetical protein